MAIKKARGLIHVVKNKIVDKKLYKHFYIWKNKSDIISHSLFNNKIKNVLMKKRGHYFELFTKILSNILQKNLFIKRLFFERVLLIAKLNNFKRDYGLYYNRIRYIVKDDDLKDICLMVRNPFKKVFQLLKMKIKLLNKKKGPLINKYNKILGWDSFKFKSAFTKWKKLTIVGQNLMYQSMKVNKLFDIKQIFSNLVNKHKTKFLFKLITVPKGVSKKETHNLRLKELVIIITNVFKI